MTEFVIESTPEKTDVLSINLLMCFFVFFLSEFLCNMFAVQIRFFFLCSYFLIISKREYFKAEMRDMISNQLKRFYWNLLWDALGT